MLRAAVTSNGPCHKHHGAWFRSVRPSFGIKFPMIASGGLMLAGTKRRSPTWQLSLLLVIFGGVVGYSCFENLDIWGNGRQHQALYGIGFFAGIVVFISGNRELPRDRRKSRRLAYRIRVRHRRAVPRYASAASSKGCR